jgi:hypothetical protein
MTVNGPSPGSPQLIVFGAARTEWRLLRRSNTALNAAHSIGNSTEAEVLTALTLGMKPDS